MRNAGAAPGDYIRQSYTCLLYTSKMAALCSAQMILYGPLAGLSIYFTHFFAIFLQKPRKNAVFPVDSVKKAGFALKSSGFLLYAHPVSYTHLDVYKRQELDEEPAA